MAYKNQYNVAIFCRNSAKDYSGGRYHAWIIAEALSHAGHRVYFVTQASPVFYHDFKDYLNHEKIKLYLTENREPNLPEYKIDVVLVVPDMSSESDFYTLAIRYARRNRARMILLNFETPNFFNETAAKKRDPEKWQQWQRVSRYAACILSSTHISDTYARKYYKNVGPITKFTFAYPAINSLVADNTPVLQRQKRIVLITRFIDAEHKGANEISNLFCSELNGYTFVLIVGSGVISPNILGLMEKLAKKFVIKIEVKYRISDIEKFSELKKASLLVFPSFFEGYGYPPVESLYCNTPCVAFDLPVLRETCRDKIVYAKIGDWEDLKKKMIQLLKNPPKENLRKGIEDIAKLERFSDRLTQILEDG
jgi:glycosyltransferase involved in cell wall biosynthesis